MVVARLTACAEPPIGRSIRACTGHSLGRCRRRGKRHASFACANPFRWAAPGAAADPGQGTAALHGWGRPRSLRRGTSLTRAFGSVSRGPPRPAIGSAVGCANQNRSHASVAERSGGRTERTTCRVAVPGPRSERGRRARGQWLRPARASRTRSGSLRTSAAATRPCRRRIVSASGRRAPARRDGDRAARATRGAGAGTPPWQRRARPRRAWISRSIGP